MYEVISFFRHSEKIVPMIYYCLITISACGQTAIFFKRRIENKIDPVQPNNVNNKQWNNAICTNFWLLFLISFLFTVGMASRYVTFTIFSYYELSEEDQWQLHIQIVQLIQSVGVPLFMYVKNGKLFKHVKTEILA